MRGSRALIALLAVVALVAGGCGGKKASTSGPTVKPVASIGATEGQLNLVAWGGYVEDGSNDPNYDWVHPFQTETGCTIKVEYANTSDEMFRLMTQGGGTLYDGVSASGDASNRLIAAGAVAAVDPKLFPAFNDVLPELRAPAHNTVSGIHYGVPYMYGPNFLMYNPDVVKPAPTSWDITWETTLNGQPNPYAGKITAYDVAIFIADAAMYLKAHKPELGITDPYELTEAQLTAAIDLLKQQRDLIGKRWSLYTDEIDGFESGALVAGTAWPINLSLIEADKKPVAEVLPSEGATGWADTWMMSSKAKHPNCMLKWMQYTMRPEVQSQVALWYGAAASNAKACDLVRTALGKDANLVDSVRYGNCGDEQFLKSLYLWKTPQANCGNGKNNCTDYLEWESKYTQVVGA
jgi:putative spermidine/putrescine transport system substrate-binding protein